MSLTRMNQQIPTLIYSTLPKFTVFENHKKCLIEHCERSELRLHYEWNKINQKWQNGPFWRLIENLKFSIKNQTGQF